MKARRQQSHTGGLSEPFTLAIIFRRRFLAVERGGARRAGAAGGAREGPVAVTGGTGCGGEGRVASGRRGGPALLPPRRTSSTSAYSAAMSPYSPAYETRHSNTVFRRRKDSLEGEFCQFHYINLHISTFLL